MTFLFQLLYTCYFAALTWTLYSVLSTPRPTPRLLLFGIGGATVLLVLLHTTLGATPEALPTDAFFGLLQFSGMLMVLQVVNPWLRRTFASRATQKGLPATGTEKVLAVNAFLANKALYSMIYLYQVLAIWVPGVL